MNFNPHHIVIKQEGTSLVSVTIDGLVLRAVKDCEVRFEAGSVSEVTVTFLTNSADVEIDYASTS